jgi:hypothetical protein
MHMRLVTASMRASFRNDARQPISMLTMAVDPNRVPGTFTLTSVQGTASTSVELYTLTGPRLDVRLRTLLKPGCRATITLAFTLKVLQVAEARLPYLGYTDRQLNLGHWLPQFPPLLNGDWFIPREWTIGEYWVDGLGDYQVRARLTGDPRAILIGPGDVTRPSDDTWEFTLRQARSFTLAASAAMSRLDGVAAGVAVEVYYFTEGQPETSPVGTPLDGPAHALQTALRTVEQFTALLGELPYRRLVVIEGDFRDGMEFSGMVHVGHKWFKDFEGKADSWLTLITAHEVVHQWWYALVANDQNAAPLLDETLATYSEVLFLEQHYPDLVPWWWTFRVKIHQPQGYVDVRADEFSNRRLYINAVYLRGVSMLQNIRDVIGDPAFIGWLQRYTRDNWQDIADMEDLWAAMPPDDYARIESIRRQYLRNPDPRRVPPSPTPAG